jgi:hypothetical protein
MKWQVADPNALKCIFFYSSILPLDEFYLDVFMHNGILFSHKEE